MESFGLSIVGTGASNSYDARVDSGIISAFATAAYRLHSLIPKTIPFVDNEGSTAAEIDLSETSNNPSVVYEKDAFSKLVNGLTNADLQAHDRFFTNQISNHLFRPFGAAFGMDLVALNIQRGRDHGLPGYNTWRKVCGLGQFRRFDEMSKAMRPESVQAIQSVYEHVDDIDLFVGGVSEIPLDGALVGPTFACIIGEQFRRIKVGDRFWYENANMAHSLTNAQMQEIKKTSLARVLCDNSVSSESMQRFAFIQPVGDWNKKVNCKSDAIPKLDIRKWQR
ncbi:Peroxidase-like protein 3 [Halotydeus destructor]|nr:Peroxidase-like protein 3 [Halotydeus destructor]